MNDLKLRCNQKGIFQIPLRYSKEYNARMWSLVSIIGAVIVTTLLHNSLLLLGI